MRLVLKVLCPDAACQEFSRLQLNTSLEDNTNTDIIISGPSEYFPGYARCRIVSIAGFKLDAILKVFEVVQNIVENNGGHEKKLVICVLAVTDDGAGELLGEKGCNMVMLTKEFHGVNVNIQKRNAMDSGVGERFLEISGKTHNNAKVIRSLAKRLIEIACQPRLHAQPVHGLKYSGSSNTSDILKQNDVYRPPPMRASPVSPITNLGMPPPLRDTAFNSLGGPPPLRNIALSPASSVSTTSCYIEGNCVKNWVNNQWVNDYNYDVFKL